MEEKTSIEKEGKKEQKKIQKEEKDNNQASKKDYSLFSRAAEKPKEQEKTMKAMGRTEKIKFKMGKGKKIAIASRNFNINTSNNFNCFFSSSSN